MTNFKTVNLIVSSSQTPFEITISSCSNNFISRRKVFSNSSSFCLCTNACCLKVSGKYNNQIIVKQVILGCCSCQRVAVSFNFNTLQPLPPSQTQIFSLTDKTYNFPIPDAILNFQNL